MAPPLVTLLAAEPEVQYVALRNISLIVQRRPAILANEVKVRAARSGGGGEGRRGERRGEERGEERRGEGRGGERRGEERRREGRR